MADVEEFKDAAGHHQQDHHVHGDDHHSQHDDHHSQHDDHHSQHDDHHAHHDEEEPRDPAGDVIETFEQVTHGQLTSEEQSAGHHRIHSEDEPLKAADDILLDEETAPAESDAVEDSGAELIEAEKEEDAEVDGVVVEPTEEPEAEVETSDVVQAENVDDAELEGNKEEKVEDDRKSGDGETENVRFEEVPAEIITTTENESLPTEVKETGEKPSLESEIFDVFKLFDYETNDSIDISDLGNVLRCLQLNPTEADVKALTEEFSTESSKISWPEFLPKMIEIVEADRFKPATEDELITAFSLLDTDKKGFLTVEQLRAALLKLGEPLNEEEFEEMLATATDFDADCFNYVEYAKLLVCN